MASGIRPVAANRTFQRRPDLHRLNQCAARGGPMPRTETIQGVAANGRLDVRLWHHEHLNRS